MIQEETLDVILDKSLRLYQKKKGYRFSLDSLLLAHFISLKEKTKTIELGSGSGVILLLAAKRFQNIEFTGLEIQKELAALSEKNVGLNSMGDKIKIINADARQVPDLLKLHSFDTVIFNPPYRKLDAGRINPNNEKAIARHELTGSLKVFLEAAKYLLKHSGKVFAIYPAGRMAELICRFRENKIEPKRMKLIFSERLSDASFVLIEGRKSAREELKIEAPLFIYNEDKTYTNEMKIIFRELACFESGGDD